MVASVKITCCMKGRQTFLYDYKVYHITLFQQMTVLKNYLII